MGSAGHQTGRLTLYCSAMDGLPAEMLSGIMDLLPIKCLFLCMGVSKRWNQVAVNAVKRRKQLSVGPSPVAPVHSLHVSSKNVIASVSWDLFPHMWACLNKYTVDLEVLLIADSYCFNCHRMSWIEPLVAKHTETLRHLSVYMTMQVPRDGKRFSRLQTIRCLKLSRETLAACPVMKTVIEVWDGSMSSYELTDDDWYQMMAKTSAIDFHSEDMSVWKTSHFEDKRCR